MIFGVKWYLWLVLLLAVVLLIFTWHKAMEASRKRRERLKKEAAIWKRDYDLRQNFSVLTETKIKETDDSELLHGVAMNIQVALENTPDMNAFFNDLPNEKKYIYALEYFDEDCKTSLSCFFRNNGAPLVPIIPEALCVVGFESYVDFFKKLYPMFDEESDVSIDLSLIAKTDEEFASVFDSDALCRACSQYIKNNKEIFLS